MPQSHPVKILYASIKKSIIKSCKNLKSFYMELFIDTVRIGRVSLRDKGLGFRG